MVPFNRNNADNNPANQAQSNVTGSSSGASGGNSSITCEPDKYGMHNRHA